MTNDQIIEEAKTMAMHMNDEGSAWRGSITKLVFSSKKYGDIKYDEVRQLFGQAFRNEI